MIFINEFFIINKQICNSIKLKYREDGRIIRLEPLARGATPAEIKLLSRECGEIGLRHREVWHLHELQER